MNTAFEMLKAAEKAGFTFKVACEGETFETCTDANKAWVACCAVDCAEVLMTRDKVTESSIFIPEENGPREEWAMIIPELDNNETLADFYAVGWINTWWEANVR